MSNSNIEPLNKFFERIKQMSRTKSKDIRFSLEEIQELSISISQILLRQTELLEQVSKLQQTIISWDQPILVEIGGGKL